MDEKQVWHDSTRRKLAELAASYQSMPEDELYEQWKRLYPAGSGPLAVMRHATALIMTVAHLRGIDTSNWA